MFAERLAEVIETRARHPEFVAEAAARRARAPWAPALLGPGGTLVLIAADHPARDPLENFFLGSSSSSRSRSS